jgi:CRISPR/Cas system CSM-associated protein Csm3 (group 7 of RAMP superfamily)
VVAVPQARLTFEVTFHGPVRVGTGRAGSGLDDTVDPRVVVPGSSLKGLMRAEAAMLFGGGPHRALVDRVFGTARRPSPWHWGDLRADDDGEPLIGARIRVDSSSGAVVDSGLFLASHHWPGTGQVAITQFTALDPDELDRQKALLAASAMSVTSVGGDRNRGFGWVDIKPQDASLDATVAALIGAPA